jgi:hypothetical protein
VQLGQQLARERRSAPEQLDEHLVPEGRSHARRQRKQRAGANLARFHCCSTGSNATITRAVCCASYSSSSR